VVKRTFLGIPWEFPPKPHLKGFNTTVGWRGVKYNYCPDCEKAYLKSRLEKDRCIYCGSACNTVDVKRSRLYYFGYGLMALAAVVIIVTRLWFDDYFILWLGGIFLIIMGGAVVLDANGKMARRAAEEAKGTSDEPSG
jgi:hypothetical protein